MTTATPDIRPLTIPSSLHAPEAADFLEMVRVRNIVYDEISDNRDEELDPAVLLPLYRPSPFAQCVCASPMPWASIAWVRRCATSAP